MLVSICQITWWRILQQFHLLDKNLQSWSGTQMLMTVSLSIIWVFTFATMLLENCGCQHLVAALGYETVHLKEHRCFIFTYCVHKIGVFMGSMTHVFLFLFLQNKRNPCHWKLTKCHQCSYATPQSVQSSQPLWGSTNDLAFPNGRHYVWNCFFGYVCAWLQSI